MRTFTLNLIDDCVVVDCWAVAVLEKSDSEEVCEEILLDYDLIFSEDELGKIKFGESYNYLKHALKRIVKERR